jgi:hypothetical protein
VIILAQTMDSCLMLVFRKTCAIVLQPDASDYGGQRAVCLSADDDAVATNSPFGNDYVLSLGYAITAVLVAPFSVANLDDNVVLQVRRCAAGGCVKVGQCDAWTCVCPCALHAGPSWPTRCSSDDAPLRVLPLPCVAQVGGLVAFTVCCVIILAQFIAMGLSPSNAPLLAPATTLTGQAQAYIPAFETVRMRRGRRLRSCRPRGRRHLDGRARL